MRLELDEGSRAIGSTMCSRVALLQYGAIGAALPGPIWTLGEATLEHNGGMGR